MALACNSTNVARERVRLPLNSRVQHRADALKTPGTVGAYRNGFNVVVRWDDGQVGVFDSRDLERIA